MSDIKFKEKCIWYYNTTSPEKTYYIYNQKTTTAKSPYSPSCSQFLCNIEYDNNKINIKLAGGKNVCIPVTIRNNCPSIKVTVPDDTFSVIDSIDSRCADGVEEVNANRAIINDKHPSWDIITENRTCVLGYLWTGNPNVNGPVGNIGGCVVTCACGGCGTNLSNLCSPPVIRQCGYGNCGQTGDNSRPWNVYVNGIHVNFPLATSNGRANTLLNTEWEANMKQIYANIAACKANLPGNIREPLPNNTRTYSVNDIVEGVVPGSCNFNIGSISYPATMYRGTQAGGVSRNIIVTVRVAYYTYAYRRPKNIQDILKGPDISKKCNERATQCNPAALKITSNYNTETCTDTPICYDTNVDGCRTDQYCCRANKIEFI